MKPQALRLASVPLAGDGRTVGEWELNGASQALTIHLCAVGIALLVLPLALPIASHVSRNLRLNPSVEIEPDYLARGRPLIFRITRPSLGGISRPWHFPISAQIKIKPRMETSVTAITNPHQLHFTVLESRRRKLRLFRLRYVSNSSGLFWC